MGFHSHPAHPKGDAVRKPAPAEFRVSGYSKSCSSEGRSNWRSIDSLLAFTAFLSFSPLVFSLYVLRTCQATTPTTTRTKPTTPATSMTRPYSRPVSNASFTRAGCGAPGHANTPVGKMGRRLGVGESGWNHREGGTWPRRRVEPAMRRGRGSDGVAKRLTRPCRYRSAVGTICNMRRVTCQPSIV